MHAEISDFTERYVPKWVATIRMVNGEVQIEGDPGETTLKMIRAMRIRYAHLDDEAFLRRFPYEFSGTYTRAKFVAKD